nr:immunoglobulin heavy chain junction region [Homo sapiens]
VSANEQPESR